jgi:hypothetical protein
VTLLPRLIVLLALSAASCGAPSAAHAAVGPPFGVGDSSGNIRLNTRDPAAIRWVARRTGTIARLWVKTRTATHGGAMDSSYYSGTTGTWEATTYATASDGRPATGRVLARERFVPVARMRADGAPFGNAAGEAIGLRLSLPVTRGAEYITVVQNVDPLPALNYASLNFLYSAAGLQGAQGRNERRTSAPDAMYGLDPRELVGGSRGGVWYLPGNNFGQFAKFLPTYVQQFSDGSAAGQPYYSGSSVPAGRTIKQRFVVRGDRTIGAVGAFLTAPDGFLATVFVNGASRRSVELSGGADRIVTRTLGSPLKVASDSIVEIVATPHTTGSLKALYADDVFEQLMGLPAGHRALPLYPVYA